MIIVEIYAGLGNQLFQYANARALSIKLNQELFFDLSFFEKEENKNAYRLDKFNTQINIANNDDILRLKRTIKQPAIYRKVSRALGLSPYQNDKFHFDEEWFQNNNVEKLKKHKDIYIYGYFADKYYMREIQNIIKKEFTLKEPLNLENLQLEEKMY